MISLNKFLFLFGNFQQISYNILQYLDPEEALELSLTCKSLQSTVNNLVEGNKEQLNLLWSKAQESSSDESDGEVKKEVEKAAKKKNKNNKKDKEKAEKQKDRKWLKKNIFEVDETLKKELVNFQYTAQVELDKLDKEVQEKFCKGNLNAFFVNEANNQLIVVNRTLVDMGLNFEMLNEVEPESKYGDLLNSEEFSQKNFDFSNPKALMERQKLILESLSKKDAEKELMKKNFIPKVETLLKYKKITVILCQGGYFSIGIFDKNKSIFHKSDHKYVVRKKAGKRQIARDNNAGSNIKSMGSQIRRDQEKKHQENVNTILTESYKQIKDSDIILYHAPSFNRYLILDVGSPMWDLRSKFRSICLTPKKANYTEVERIYEYLTKFYVMPLKPNKQET